MNPTLTERTDMICNGYHQSRLGDWVDRNGNRARLEKGRVMFLAMKYCGFTGECTQHIAYFYDTWADMISTHIKWSA